MKQYEELIKEIINEAVEDCVTNFTLSLDNSDMDFEEAFEKFIDKKLEGLELHNAEVEGDLPIEKIRTVIEACRRDFNNQIYNAINDAFAEAEREFISLLEEIQSEMFETVESFTEAVL